MKNRVHSSFLWYLPVNTQYNNRPLEAMKYLGAFFLVSLLSCCLGYPGYLQEEWADWKKTHSKFYSSVQEEGERLGVWQANYKKIMEHNMANKSFTLGLNEFADLVRVRAYRQSHAANVHLKYTFFILLSTLSLAANLASTLCLSLAIYHLYRHKKSLQSSICQSRDMCQIFPGV